MTRSEQREEVFILLFEKTFHECSVDEVVEIAKEYRSDKINESVVSTLNSVYEHLDEIDTLIEQNSKNWKISRIPRVTLCIMRLCVYEMIHDEGVPVGVAINEAVELCKKYGTDDDRKFANGVLGSISRNL